MNSDRSILFLRALADELTPQERSELESLLERDPTARTEYESLRDLEAELQSSRREAFAPAFLERVMTGIEQKSKGVELTISDALSRFFVRIALSASVIAIGFGAYNAATSVEGQSTVESLLGLPSVSYESTYTFDDVYTFSETD